MNWKRPLLCWLALSAGFAGVHGQTAGPAEAASPEWLPFPHRERPWAEGADPLSPEAIGARLEALFAPALAARLAELSWDAPPDYVLLRVYKQSGECELWGARGPADRLRLLARLPVCAMDRQPGPKLREGDRRTPEGFYHCRTLYASTRPNMWIDLAPGQVERAGEVGRGSAFRLCSDFPNAVDKALTRKLLGRGVSAGSAICVHGNCSSVGCVSFMNADFLSVFYLASLHDVGRYGPLPLHILPFRLGDVAGEAEAWLEANPGVDAASLEAHWAGLRAGEAFFERHGLPFRARATRGGYRFALYSD